MNLGIFSGRLGKDAELGRRNAGDAVLNFSLAVDIGTKQEPKTMWVECALWGKRGEALQQYLVKGMKVTVTGRVSLDEYTSKQDGQKRTAMRLTLNEIDLHGDKAGNQAARPAPAADGPINDDGMPF
jgi:single-strand DNA-binding protein